MFLFCSACFQDSNSTRICDFRPPCWTLSGTTFLKLGATFLIQPRCSKILVNLPSKSQADLRKEMLRRCFAKRDQSGGACLVLLAKPWKTSCHMSKIYAKDSRSKEVSTGPAIAADPPSCSIVSQCLKRPPRCSKRAILAKFSFFKRFVYLFCYTFSKC